LIDKVKFVWKRVVGFQTNDDKIISLKTSDGEVFKLDKYVISAGMGSPSIGKALGIHIPLLAMKGLSIDVHHKGEGLSETLIDASKQAAFVRMGNITRITAFGDADGNNLDINPIRKDQIWSFAK